MKFTHYFSFTRERQDRKYIELKWIEQFIMRFSIDHSIPRINMDIRYFKDTDTLLLVFNENEVVATDDINENFIVDLDAKGNPVSLTIEHATALTNVNGLSFKQFNGDKVKELVAI